MNLYRSKEYYIEDVMPKLSPNGEIWVMTGITALNLSNVHPCCVYEPIVLYEGDTSYTLEGVVKYVGVGKGNVDYVNYVTPYYKSPNILIPTKERALVECIKYNTKMIDPGTLLDAVFNYTFGLDPNMELLYEVADFYKLPKEELDKWIQEAEESLEEI